MEVRSPDVVVVGAGIGGLSAALCLHQLGLAVVVCEQAEVLHELGVGLNVLPPAVAVLAELGLLDAVLAAGVPTAALVMTNRRGDVIWRERRGVAAGHRVPQVSVHRGRLQRVLADALVHRAGGSAIRLGHRLIGFDQDDHGVVARFVDRAGSAIGAISCAVLVGADGIHSTVRAIVRPGEGPPLWNGSMLWRGATEWPMFLDGRSMIVAGGMAGKVVVYPNAAGATPTTRLTNWGIVAPQAPRGATPPRREDWSRPAQRVDVDAQVQRFTSDVVDIAGLVAATADILEYPLCDRDPLDRWSHDRVTLLGDAAHPMYSMGSNGATQAIVDGQVLARCLAGSSVDHCRGLAAYEHDRRPATSRLVELNRAGGPERVIDLVERLAPSGFDSIDDVIAADHLRAIVGEYAQATKGT